MRHTLGLMLSGVVCLSGYAQERAAGEGAELKRWSKEKANEWYARQPWLVGCNFIPSSAINQLEMWQAETFDPAAIDRELKWAAGLGFNTVRVYLHDLAWEADAAGFKKRVDQFLGIADKHGIRPMLVLFDDCWNANPKVGKQPEPQAGVHNSGWLQSPGRDVVNNPEAWPRLEKYLKDVVGTFAKDKRVLLWDLYNEPGNEGQGNKSLPLLKKAFLWAREVNPTQPLSAGVWSSLKDFNDFQEAASDVITFHNYNDVGNLAGQIAGLKNHGRPVICTEWMRRGNSDVAACLPVFLKARVGCYNWGLVAGKTQTIYPWGSPKGAPEPKIWFHDLLRKDGTSFSEEEAALFRRFTARGGEAGKTLRLRLQVVKTLPDPVIHKKSPGTENIPGGFEGGSSVKVTIDGKSEYHFIVTAYPKLDWSQSKLDHWVSGDGVNFQHAGVVLENYRDEKAGMNHIFCSPIPLWGCSKPSWLKSRSRTMMNTTRRRFDRFTGRRHGRNSPGATQQEPKTWLQRRRLPRWLIAVLVAQVQIVQGVRAAPPAAFDFGNEPMRYLENARLKLGINLEAGGAVTYLEDKLFKSSNMINSFDWGRQIQLSYYSGPVPFIGPNGEKPTPEWAVLGWNPIQAGSVGRIASRTIGFEQGPDFLRARCIPMQWPHANLPGDCFFQATYRLVSDNVIRMEARIINQRLDHTQYPARNQEMPALYTNGPWYRLVTASGDAPFTGAGLTTVVGKDDAKGWPWSTFHASEHWAALVNDDNRGVGLFQADTCTMSGGFAGGDALKGRGGPKDMQTGYLSPVAKRILDSNIDMTYQTDIIVGSLDEIRAYARKQPRHGLAWRFSSDRLGWSYEHAADAGWPVREGLKITYQKDPRGSMQSDVIFWKAEDAAVLKIEASFRFDTPGQALQAEVVIQPFGPADRTDFPAWQVQDPAQKEAINLKRKQFPPAQVLIYPLEVRGDGTLHTHILKLGKNPGYRGGMKQLQLRFPPVDGSAEVRQITFSR